MHVSRVLLAATLVVGLTLASQAPASADIGNWHKIPGYGGVSGFAILDSFQSSGSARGRVQLYLTGTCAYAKYAPYASAAVDGRYNDLRVACRSGPQVATWRDSFHLAYNGYKFQICITDQQCGKELHIRAW
jgi:hypothetical protein